MKIAIISDTHGLHKELSFEDDIDMVIHCGDISNSFESSINSNEVYSFLQWYKKLNIKYKVLIAGNHDTSIERRLYKASDFKDLGITYLEHDICNIEGINIFGSPFTPTFGNWAFMKDRSKLHQYWEQISDSIDILVTHGPPKGILDLSMNRNRELEYCGDKALFNRIVKIQPKYHCFGHIHNCEDVVNQGFRIISGIKTIFINASCVTDGQFDKGLSSGVKYVNY